MTKRIEQSVEQARANAAWRSEYMKSYVYLEDARYEGRQEGLKEGFQQKRAALMSS